MMSAARRRSELTSEGEEIKIFRCLDNACSRYSLGRLYRALPGCNSSYGDRHLNIPAVTDLASTQSGLLAVKLERSQKIADCIVRAERL